MLLDADETRLFVASASTDRIAVVDTKQRRVLTEIFDSPPGGPGEGSTPSALALSSDGTRLLVAESDNNAIALIDLAPVTAGVPAATGEDRIAGRVPTQWYPTAVLARGDSLLALTGKGKGTAPNPNGPRPGLERADPSFDARQYTLGQTSGHARHFACSRERRGPISPRSRRAWRTRTSGASGRPRRRCRRSSTSYTSSRRTARTTRSSATFRRRTAIRRSCSSAGP